MADLFYDEFGIRYQDIDELIPEFEGMFEPKDTNAKRTRKSGKCRWLVKMEFGGSWLPASYISGPVSVEIMTFVIIPI